MSIPGFKIVLDSGTPAIQRALTHLSERLFRSAKLLCEHRYITALSHQRAIGTQANASSA